MTEEPLPDNIDSDDELPADPLPDEAANLPDDDVNKIPPDEGNADAHNKEE